MKIMTTSPRTVFGVMNYTTQNAEEYLRSRDFLIKNRLRSFLITANSSIKRNNREAMTRSSPSTTTIRIPKSIRSFLEFHENVFFIRQDFIDLLEDSNCSIKAITATKNTGDQSKSEVQNIIHLHIQTKHMGEWIDLGISFDFLHMPLCGVPNLLINSQLLDHINNVILKRLSEINNFQF